MGRQIHDLNLPPAGAPAGAHRIDPATQFLENSGPVNFASPVPPIQGAPPMPPPAPMPVAAPEPYLAQPPQMPEAQLIPQQVASVPAPPAPIPQAPAPPQPFGIQQQAVPSALPPQGIAQQPEQTVGVLLPDSGYVRQVPVSELTRAYNEQQRSGRRTERFERSPLAQGVQPQPMQPQIPMAQPPAAPVEGQVAAPYDFGNALDDLPEDSRLAVEGAFQGVAVQNQGLRADLQGLSGQVTQFLERQTANDRQQRLSEAEGHMDGLLSDHQMLQNATEGQRNNLGDLAFLDAQANPELTLAEALDRQVQVMIAAPAQQRVNHDYHQAQQVPVSTPAILGQGYPITPAPPAPRTFGDGGFENGFENYLAAAQGQGAQTP